MPKKLFLSHAHDDKRLAEVIATMIKHLTAGQVEVWYSSDESASGGLAAGQRWRDSLRTELQQSVAVLALLTPLSINRPWIYFESGFGAANGAIEVIPLCVGIDSLGAIPKPLEMFQAFQLTDATSLYTFLRKLFARLEMVFYEEVAKAVVEPSIAKIARISAENRYTENPGIEPNLTDAIREIKDHFDRRVADFSVRHEKLSSVAPYSFQVEIHFPDFQVNEFMQIRPKETLADKLNEIYKLLSEHVQPYTYLEAWILRDADTKEFLIVREIASRIPAEFLFAAGTRWEVLPLTQPYIASETPQVSQPSQALSESAELAKLNLPKNTVSSEKVEKFERPESRDRIQRPPGGEEPGAPQVYKPNTDELLKHMRKVDPAQAKRYRIRTGE